MKKTNNQELGNKVVLKRHWISFGGSGGERMAYKHWTGRAGLLFTRLSVGPLLAIRMMALAGVNLNKYY
jgi:hypothetical protein